MNQTPNAEPIPPRRYQRKALLCRTLAILWFLPSFGALLILLLGFRNWSRLDGVLSAFRATTFEQWIALAVLIAHPIFFLLARHFARTELFREAPPEDEGDEVGGRH